MRTFLKVVLRFVVAALVLAYAAVGVFYYAHIGDYAWELIGLWAGAAVASLFWILQPLASSGK